jgi:hypothetical protein
MKAGFLLVLFALFAGCKRNEVGEYHNFRPIDSNLGSFFFQVGSYWIYVNDSTGARDSTYLFFTNSGTDQVYYGQNQWNDWEFYDLFYRSAPGGSTFRDRIEEDHLVRNPCRGYPFGAWGVTLYSLSEDSIPHLSYLDSLPLGNHIFYHVQKFSVESDFGTCRGGFLTVNTDFYTVDSIGVIRKVVHSTPEETWDLVAWKILR